MDKLTTFHPYIFQYSPIRSNRMCFSNNLFHATKEIGIS